MKYLITATSFLILAACAPALSVEATENTAAPQGLTAITGPQAPFKSVRADGLAEMIVAGGCFWCVESDFEKMNGVVEAISGYTGGTLDNPKYKQVGTNRTGHFEAAKIIYDPKIVSYRTLIDAYWKTVDPTDTQGQFCDKGESYLSAIFATPEQRADAEASLALVKSNKPFSANIVTPILPAVTFYDAEDYHQDYYKKSPIRYKYYRNGCRRDKRLEQLWGSK